MARYGGGKGFSQGCSDISMGVPLVHVWTTFSLGDFIFRNYVWGNCLWLLYAVVMTNSYETIEWSRRAHSIGIARMLHDSHGIHALL